jgi:hypothetical protein
MKFFFKRVGFSFDFILFFSVSKGTLLTVVSTSGVARLVLKRRTLNKEGQLAGYGEHSIEPSAFSNAENFLCIRSF